MLHILEEISRLLAIYFQRKREVKATQVTVDRSAAKTESDHAGF